MTAKVATTRVQLQKKNGKTLSEQSVDKIRLDMAEACLRVRSRMSEREEYNQLPAEEAQTFHRAVFRDNNLPAKACTLETPFNMRGEKGSWPCTMKPLIVAWGLFGLAKTEDKHGISYVKEETYVNLFKANGVFDNVCSFSKRGRL